ncbi:insulin-like 5a [Anguilla rostrata]|uniref:insulin-like 5a n=1 Tax=Anguilla rostrata TaxID=7938 RepID=UPI0030CE95CC
MQTKTRGAFGVKECRYRHQETTMSKTALLPVLMLSVLCAVALKQGEVEAIKLCGREFIRAIVYTCGGSRWRRILNEPALQGVGSFEYLGTSVAVPQHRRDLNEKLTIMCCQVGCRKSDLAFFC